MGTIKKVNLNKKLSLFSDHWNPRVVAELNGQQVRLVKIKGEFVWHKHNNEDELFFVIKGSLLIEFRNKKVVLNENELLVVPKGVEHRPVANEEVSIMLFEPISTINTGNIKAEFTRDTLKKI